MMVMNGDFAKDLGTCIAVQYSNPNNIEQEELYIRTVLTLWF